MVKRKHHYRIRWKNVILLTVALALIIYLFAGLIGLLTKNKASGSDTFTACKLSTSSLRKKLTDKKYEGTMVMNDYVYYGEHLSLYSEAYTVDGGSGYVGKTILLKNLCDGTEVKIEKANGLLDGQIDLRTLPAGLYEVYVVENLLEKRLYTPNTITTSNTFYTVPHSSARNKVTVYADSALINKKDATENVLDKNYVFIDVRKETVDDRIYDIALNPGPVAIDNTYSSQGNGLDETAETFKFASAVAAKLTADGYKVLLTRGEYDWVSTYGSSGTASKAYTANAKYFISFDMYEQNTGSGLGVTYSSYTSNEFANAIYSALTTQGKMVGMDGDQSVTSCVKNGVYDNDFDIRETGGRALGAGQLSEREITDNAFAANSYGMQSIFVSLCNLANSSDTISWTTNFDANVDACVKGIETYLKK